MDEHEFANRMKELLNDKVVNAFHQIKSLDMSLSELHPVAIVNENIFYVFDYDNDMNEYAYKMKSGLQGVTVPMNILAAFPLDFYHGKPSAIISENALKNQKDIVSIFHEFVHCYQYETCEIEIKKRLKISEIKLKTNDSMWELNHPFPYEDSQFVKIFTGMNELSSYETADFYRMTSYYGKLAGILNETDYEYMIWQEWKEGYARFIENRIRSFFGLEQNIQELKEPFCRVSFYESGSRHISFLLRHHHGMSLYELFGFMFDNTHPKC